MREGLPGVMPSPGEWLSRKLRSLLRLPKGQKAVTCMVIGYPAVKYRRIVPRRPLKARVLQES